MNDNELKTRIGRCARSLLVSGCRDWVCAVGLLVAMTALAYLPVFLGEFGFVFDDMLYITKDPRMNSLAGLGEIWTQITGAGYRYQYHQYYPMTVSAFWLQYWIWQDSSYGYHVVNVLLHAANAVLLWRVLHRVRMPGSWIAAAIFAVHPVHVQSVAWITELKNVLSTLFYLSSALFLLRFLDPVDSGLRDDMQIKDRRWVWYVLAFTLFIFALLSKTVTASLPVAMLLILWWKQDQRKQWGRHLAALAPMLAVGLAFLVTTIYLESHHTSTRTDNNEMDLIDQCLIVGRALWFYAGKLIWPNPLTMIYPRWQINALDWRQWLYLITAVGTIAAIWALRNRNGRGTWVAVAYFVLAVAPVSFVKVGFTQHSYVADHWQYWSSMGLFALGAGSGTALLHRMGVVQWSGRVLIAILLVALMALTWQRTLAFENEETLWTDTLKYNSDSWQAHNSLGNVFKSQEKYNKAEHHYREALRIRPAMVGTIFNLGNLYVAKGELDRAIDYYNQSLERVPNYVGPHINLGNVLLAQDKIDEAIGHFQIAIDVTKGNALAHHNMGHALRRKGQLQDAVRHLEQALSIEPDLAESHSELGLTLETLGHLDEAIKHLQEAFRINPNLQDARENLARVRKNEGQ